MKTVQSIERAFAILDAIAGHARGLSDIAGQVQLPKSTVSRILRTLESVGVVERDVRHGSYQLGSKVGALTRAAGAIPDLRSLARPYLATLAREIGEDAGLSIPDGRQVLIAAQENADNTVQVADWTGAILPMHLIPAGLVILAHLPQERQEDVLAGPLEASTPRSVTEPDRIRGRLEEVRRDGYCWVFGEFSEDLNSVAAPIFGPDGVVGAINLHGPAFRFPQPGSEDGIAQRLAEVAGQLSEAVRGPVPV